MEGIYSSWYTAIRRISRTAGESFSTGCREYRPSTQSSVIRRSTTP